jgi:Na+/H+-dicarboxylate symporter
MALPEFETLALLIITNGIALRASSQLAIFVDPGSTKQDASKNTTKHVRTARGALILFLTQSIMYNVLYDVHCGVTRGSVEK